MKKRSLKKEASVPGWIDAIRRRAKSSTTITGKPAGAHIGALRTGAVTRVAAPSRLPSLPKDQRDIMVHPEGGLDVHAGITTTNIPKKTRPRNSRRQSNQPRLHRPPQRTATPTWTDRVTGTGETIGYARSGNLPQHENDEIHELKRELAWLRKENEEFEAFYRNLQQPSERAAGTLTPSAPAVEPASTNSSNANHAAKRRAT
ncbi:hypothetical protein MRX96_052304 [Rhipicephalus microplus]